jgi:hypothetical protein
MGADFLAEVEPVALRERVREAVYQAFSEVIATNPQLAPAAYLHRAQASLGGANKKAAVDDLRVAVASKDGPVVYKAAVQLLQMGESLAPQEWALLPDHLRSAATPRQRAYWYARDHAGIGLHGGHKSHYTAEIGAWSYASGTLLFTAHPCAILAWLHSRPGHTLALPALDRFYAAAADLGYANPMPQVWQLRGQPQMYSSQIT